MGLVAGFALRDGGRLWMAKVKHRRHLWRSPKKWIVWLEIWQFEQVEESESKSAQLMIRWICCLQVCAWLDSLYLRMCVCVCMCVCLGPCVCVPMCVFSAADDSRHAVLSAGRKRGEGGCLLFQQVAIATLRSGAAIITVITTQFWQLPSSLPLWRPPMRDKLSDLYVSCMSPDISFEAFWVWKRTEGQKTSGGKQIKKLVLLSSCSSKPAISHFNF